MATVRLIPDTRAKKDGSQMILLVIRIGKTRFVFSTGISTPSSEKFNEVSYLDKSVPQYKVKNVRLVSLKNKAEKLIIDDEARLSSLPSAKAKEIISEYVFDEKVVKKTRCFIDYLDEFVSIKSNIRIYELLSKNPVIVATDVSTTTKQTGVDKDGNPIEEKVTSVNKRNVENPLSGQAKANENALKDYNKQLNSYQQAKMQVADVVRKDYEEADTGFLEELQALFSILEESKIALGFYAFLFLFLMLLELLVVTSKGGDGNCDYDLIVEHQLNIKKNTLKQTEERLLNKKGD